MSSKAKKASGKKIPIIIAVVAVLAVAVGGLFLYNAHQDRIKAYRNTADALLYRTHSVSQSQRNEMLQGQGYRGEMLREIKDKDEFRKILAEQFQLMLDEREAASSETFVVWVSQAVAELDRQGIQDEAVRAAYQTFMAGEKEAALNSKYTGEIQRFLTSLQAAGASSFYSVDVMSEEEIADYFHGKVDGYLAEKKFDKLTDVLEMMAKTDTFSLCYPEPEKLVDTLLEQCEVYTVAKNSGGYYDGMEDGSSSSSHGLDPAGMGSSIGTTSSSSTDKYYGDFNYHSYSSSTHYDGLVDQASKDKYNSSSSGKYLYFRDLDMGGRPDAFQWAAGKGAQFAICGRNETDNDDGSGLTYVLLFNASQLYIPQGSECRAVAGSFQSQVQEARKAYQERYSLDAWYADALAKLERGDWEGALAAFRLYPDLVVSTEGLTRIASEYFKAGEYQKGIDALGLTYSWRELKGKTVEDVVKKLADYDPEYSKRNEFAPSFCRLMRSVLTPMIGEEIRANLPGKWTSLHDSDWTIGEDGSYLWYAGFNSNRRGTWTTEGNTFVAGSKYEVYNILDAYYYMVYPDSSWHGYLLAKRS